MLQPMLAAALYLVDTLGPHVAELAGQLHETEPARRSRPQPVDPVLSSLEPPDRIAAVLDEYVRSGQSLPQLPDYLIERRLTRGWDPQDPLRTLSWDVIARQAGAWQMEQRWEPQLRPAFTDAVASVGIDKGWARNAATVTTAAGAQQVPWTTSLHRMEAEAVVGIVPTAAIIVLAAITGMKASELMELRIGTCRPPEELAPGLLRYRLASKIVKGQPLGGFDDEWVVIEPAYRAAELLEPALAITSST